MELVRHRIDHQPEIYSLAETYLGWLPKNYSKGSVFFLEHVWSGKFPDVVTLISPEHREEVTLCIHGVFDRFDFLWSLLENTNAKSWYVFLFVSKQDTPEAKFIIPMK